MKIFIIYASAGSGHKKFAESVFETASDRFGPGVRCFDILDYSSDFFKFLYSKGYIILISKLQWLWAIFFFLSDTSWLGWLNTDSRSLLNRYFCKNFLQHLTQEQPDVIISTHFLVNELVSFLRERGVITTRLISLVTDFGVHNFWVAKNVDVYAVASEQTRSILLSKGVNPAKIHVTGLPTRKQFQKPMDAAALKVKFGLKPDAMTVLILTGGIGIGPIYEIVSRLGGEVNCIVVCGANKQLYQQLQNLGHKRLVVFGWIDFVEEVMKVSDIVITKPGGSTIAECLLMRLPMIFFSIIPGQEYTNARILSGSGAGLTILSPRHICEKTLFFKRNPQEIAAIREKIQDLSFCDSGNKLLELLHA